MQKSKRSLQLLIGSQKKPHRINLKKTFKKIKIRNRKSNKKTLSAVIFYPPTYIYDKHPSSAHTSRQAWSSSSEADECVDRGPGTGRLPGRASPGPWWRRRDTPPCLSTSSTTASCRAPAGSSGRTCTRRAAEETCLSAMARRSQELEQASGWWRVTRTQPRYATTRLLTYLLPTQHKYLGTRIQVTEL